MQDAMGSGALSWYCHSRGVGAVCALLAHTQPGEVSVRQIIECEYPPA